MAGSDDALGKEDGTLMNTICTAVKAIASLGLLMVVLGGVSMCEPARAGTLPVGVEKEYWSDMAFPGGVTGGFNSGTLQLTVAASPSNDLEIGGELGPSHLGRHYGAGGTLGGAFSAALSVSGVQVQPDGTVTDGGSVTVKYNGGVSGSLGTDYGIAAGAWLLQGSVAEVLLDATGDNTLDVLFSINGGALQTANPSLGTNFSPAGWGLIRVVGVTMPSTFSETFSLSGATIDVYGIPEPASIMLGLVGVVYALVGSRKRRAG
jgi:hypothetical protein